MKASDILKAASKDILSVLGEQELAQYDDGMGVQTSLTVIFREDGAEVDALGVRIEDKEPTAWVSGSDLSRPRNGAQLTLADGRIYVIRSVDPSSLGLTKLKLHYGGMANV